MITGAGRRGNEHLRHTRRDLACLVHQHRYRLGTDLLGEPSSRCYWPTVELPVAVTPFPRDLPWPTSGWVELAHPIFLYCNEADRGASALEQPGTLVDDIRTGLRTCDRPARHTACSEQSIERPGCKGIRLTMARAATNHVVRVPMVPRPRLQTLSWRPDKSLNVVEQAGCLCDIGNEEQELLKFPQRLNAFFILESQKNLLIRSRSQPDSFATAFRYLQRAPTRVARVDPARDITELLERSDCLRGSLPRDMEGTSKRGRVDGTAIDRLHRGVVGGRCSWMAA